MTDQTNRRARQLVTDLEKIQQDLSQEDFYWLTPFSHTEYKLFYMARKGDTGVTVSVTCSLNQVSVAFWDTQSGYIFRTQSSDPLTVMTAEEPICPEDWEQNLFSHSNNGPEQEGYYWDFENYAAAVTELREKWYANRDKFSDPITSNALQSAIREADIILGVAPSLPDVVSLNNSWHDKWHPLPEQVPVDDYLLWDRQFLRALAVIYLLSTNPPA